MTGPTTVSSLGREWRFAKAIWDAALYAPELEGRDLPEDVEDRLSNAEGEAFDKFMAAPALTIGDLLQKLIAFREEGGWQLNHAASYVDAFVADARRLHEASWGR